MWASVMHCVLVENLNSDVPVTGMTFGVGVQGFDAGAVCEMAFEDAA
jgi:hypothetical protein